MTLGIDCLTPFPAKNAKVDKTPIHSCNFCLQTFPAESRSFLRFSFQLDLLIPFKSKFVINNLQNNYGISSFSRLNLYKRHERWITTAAFTDLRIFSTRAICSLRKQIFDGGELWNCIFLSKKALPSEDDESGGNFSALLLTPTKVRFCITQSTWGVLSSVAWAVKFIRPHSAFVEVLSSEHSLVEFCSIKTLTSPFLTVLPCPVVLFSGAFETTKESVSERPIIFRGKVDFRYRDCLELFVKSSRLLLSPLARVLLALRQLFSWLSNVVLGLAPLGFNSLLFAANEASPTRFFMTEGLRTTLLCATMGGVGTKPLFSLQHKAVADEFSTFTASEEFTSLFPDRKVQSEADDKFLNLRP